MTAASVSSGGHDDAPARDWRDKLAAALNGTAHLGCEEFSPDDADSGCPDCEDVFRVADALLPVVAGIVAGELRQAACDLRDHQAKAVVKASEHQPGSDRFVKEVGRASGYGAAAWRLCARADGIDPT